ncbi:conserved hypothetical protein [Ricinus communis]|uniref:Reverse transcriptase zinc-binding domain-containing protein n=1 Tax=Ricinus communis TaxID=3988 RepID=B9SSL7_RICCO|nr:conserved hypothetical protein [Ricinus communis]
MHVPDKIDVFLWKILSNALSIGSLLVQRLAVDGTCQRCGAWETSGHLFFLCPFAQYVWRISSLSIIPSVFHVTSITLVWDHLCATLWSFQLDQEPYKIIAHTLWQHWKARNKFVFDNHWLQETDIISQAPKDI